MLFLWILETKGPVLKLLVEHHFLQNHNATYLTDVEEEDDDATHWQSVTMDDEMRNLASTSVNLTMSLGKSLWRKCFYETSIGENDY